MTLNEFCAEECRRLKMFKEMWEKHMILQPDKYPLDNPEGEWWEQLQTFDPDYEGDGG